MSTIHVAAGGNLQAAINSAVGGDLITLEAGATFTGNFVLPNRAGAEVTIRTVGTLPVPLGTSAANPPWITNTVATGFPYAKLVVSDANYPIMTCAHGAHDWKLDGLHLLPNTAQPGRAMLEMGHGELNALSQVPINITIDRCYFQGDPTVGTKRALELNSITGICRRSYFKDIFFQGEDSQAIHVRSSPGPTLVESNYMECASEPFLSAGANCYIPNQMPGNLTFRNNYCFKPLGWTAYNRQVKNNFELKAMETAIIEGNVFENCWVAAQDGSMVLFTVRNDEHGSPWYHISHITFRYNVLINCEGYALNIDAQDYAATSARGVDMLIHDNLMINCAKGILLNRPFDPTVIKHNT
jgi:hypothetical protein